MKNTTECIMWPGYRDEDGYGRVKINGRMYRAHRVALENKVGRKLLRAEHAMHTCHTPGCVNPAHLEIGSAAENNRQAQARKQTLAKTILGITEWDSK